MSTISNAPTILKDFLSYHETVKAHSAKTVDEYFLDLRTFFRYLKRSRGLVSPDTPWDSISIADVDLELVGSVSLSEIYDYLIFLSRERQLNTASLARKIAAIRSFYRYLTSKAHLLEENPVQELAPNEENAAALSDLGGIPGAAGRRPGQKQGAGLLHPDAFPELRPADL